MERKLVEVERGNVVLKIPEDTVQRYIDRGFSLLDENGNVIKTSIPNDVGTLQKAFVEQSEEIKKLKAELAKLKEQDAKLKEQNKPRVGRKKKEE